MNVSLSTVSFLMNTHILSVIVRDRSGILYQDSAKAISSVNERGIFDILPEHANFISIIQDRLIIHRHDGSKHEIKLTRGVIKVHQNTVQIYLGVLPQFLTE